MKKKAALLRVGIDKGCGGILSPLFDDGTFELIWIPEYYNQKNKKGIVEKRTYATTRGMQGKFLIDYFPEGSNREKHRDCPIHVDPEFKTFTYGDPHKAKGTLMEMEAGSYLIFYAGLQPVDKTNEDGLYLIGYFEIEETKRVTSIKEADEVKKKFKNNFHVMQEAIFKRDVTKPENGGLKLVKGNKNSRLLKYAVKISVKKKYKTIKTPTDLLDPKLYKIFGDFNGKVSLRRNPTRWIDEKYVEKAIEFVKGLR